MGIIFVDVPDNKLPKAGLLRPDFRNVNWAVVGKTIREQRFSEIRPEIWDLLADKLDPPKRGKGRPQKKKGDGDVDSIAFWQSADKAIVQGDSVLSAFVGMTISERTQWVYDRYNELRNDGLKSEPALQQITDESPWSRETIGAALTAQRKIQKAYQELLRKVPELP